MTKTESDPFMNASGPKKIFHGTLVSRNMIIAGHRTSVRLEPDMWTALSEICHREHATLHDIGTMVAQRKLAETSLTAAIRVFIMIYYKAAATEDGHARAGHGVGISSTFGEISKSGFGGMQSSPSGTAKLSVVPPVPGRFRR
jgi:predicted DNA-binding ribbon-helix-helix protein